MTWLVGMLWVAALPGCGGPARPEAEIRASRARPLARARGACRLRVGAEEHDAVWLLDGPRWHLAVLGPLRTPTAVLRSDGRGFAVTVGAEHRVAEEASAVLVASALPTLADVAGLVAGRLVDRPVRGASFGPDGRAAVAQQGLGTTWVSLLGTEGAVEVLSVTADGGRDLFGFSRSPGVLPERMSLTGAGGGVTLSCTWSELGEVPATAFALDPPPGVQRQRLESLGLGLLATLVDSGRLPHRRER